MSNNFKLRKKKVGLVLIVFAVMYITTQGQAEASENTYEVSHHQNIQNIEYKQVGSKSKIATESPTNSVFQSIEEIEEKQKDTKENVQANYVKLDKVTPGNKIITGKTLPNKMVSLTIDDKSFGSVEEGDSGFIKSDESGSFEFDLKDRKIVFNQKVHVSSSNFDTESEENSEESMLEEEKEETDTTITDRYDKAYVIPEKQLEKLNGHHQVLVEPILKDSGIIKGHTSVKGRVALSINNNFVNLSDSSEYEKAMSNDDAKSRIDGIWKHIDDRGYFEFDFKRTPFESHQINKDDLISITFKPDDEEEALMPLIFNIKASDFDNVATAKTSYSPKDVSKVVILNNGTDDLEVEDIYGFMYESDRGIDKIVDRSKGTREIKGKTKFANSVIKVYSSIGQDLPDLKVNDNGEFSFDMKSAKYRLYNGEELSFVVVGPVSGELLSSNFITKKINIYETPEQKAEREFEEKLERTPAYYTLLGDNITGYNLNGDVITWFNVFEKAKINRF
ncbi:hypothetical protein GZ142_12700 [Staphylococcus aureus]|uniref:hypothetical protein n=1 Tax=Staphylococcus aureus TaxID=1280 RepID=UPI00139EF75E|nr:hypothetical protein [Staphylococcus aureus]NDP54638.1 hypothetical protein [Staphylococcus aureus]NDQ33848.1 hypothetical protein [Staphylococcus aureus]NDQ44363.1 hypothetical protein [Staphylococcus aureus]